MYQFYNLPIFCVVLCINRYRFRYKYKIGTDRNDTTYLNMPAKHGQKTALLKIYHFRKYCSARLQKVINTYSKDKEGNPIEVTDRLRVLGVLIGSNTLCNDFISKAMITALS